jgi:hypothetical protein
MPIPTWPEILTNTDWQKKKGAISKIGGKTGVGEAMTASQNAFKGIDWSLFDAATALPMPKDRDPDKIVAAKAACVQEFKTKVEPTRAQLKTLRDKATAVAGAWKKNRLIPASSTKHIEDVTKAADAFSLGLAGNSQNLTTLLKTFDTMLAVKQKAEQDELAKVDVTIANLEKALLEAAAKPTKKSWSEGSTSAHQRCRSMCNMIRNVPKLKAKYWGTWQKFGDEYHKDAAEGALEAAAMKKKIETVKTELAKFKASYKKDLA